MEYKTTRYKYTYTRKTRDRYQIHTKPKHDKRAEWLLILDTFDREAFQTWHDAIKYPLTATIKTPYTTKTHTFKFSRFREKIEPAAPQPLRVCYRCLMGIESHEGQQITRKIYLDDDDPTPCDWCEEDGNDVLYEIL
jgi:hypothetical protein